jgi:hypothetical protein
MAVLRVGTLPQGALDAAAVFHAEVLPGLRVQLDAAADHLVLVFGPADPDHRGWRLAMVRDLARQYAPVRVNALVSDDETAILAAARYCADAPGLTGHMLVLDGKGAGGLLSDPA